MQLSFEKDAWKMSINQNGTNLDPKRVMTFSFTDDEQT
jgi:hypothetical protein